MNPAGFSDLLPAAAREQRLLRQPRISTPTPRTCPGTSARSKVRLRWYGEEDRPEKTTLEVKRRRNHLGWKHHYPVGAVDFTASTWSSLRRQVRKRLSQEGRLWLDAHPQPVLINHYHRQYFESPGGQLRATLDWRQAVFDQRFKARPNLARHANLPNTLVVEIKFQRENHVLGSRVAQGIPIRVSRNSKYMIGVRSILAPLGA